ncbi:YdcF family protein [Halothermothrix orenii]|uniref:YdcF family protein n=1 Tax=Halothermothrix orenii TaxID=31909 RepID=UPI001438CD02|nr:YdcF family protein [Halothermothrix orenii]
MVITVYLIKKRSNRLIVGLACISLVLMYILSSAVGVMLFLIPLETKFPYYNISRYDKELPIVVLGGGINYFGEKGEGKLNPITLQRLVTGYRLYKEVETTLIFTGGQGIGHSGPSEADVAGEFLRELGINQEALVLENRARNTYENGLYVRDYLEQRNGLDRGVYLVTSAVHLPRAVGVFRRLNLKVVPVPAGYFADHTQGWLDFFPARSNLNATLAAIHEWIGLLWYKVRGRI